MAGGVRAGGPLLRRFARDERGAVAIEYGLIAALMVAVLIASVYLLSSNLMANFWNKIRDAFTWT